jgi:nucleosome binding factor SPN SPT16 subunit
MEASYSLDQTRRSGYDPDELEEEQRERAMRARMNQEFQNYVKKIEEAAKDLEFDIPYRDLGFYGVPNKSTCFIMPAVNALVELTEPPWLVVALNDIEVAHFERVVYGLKNFDLVLVLKDFAQKPLQINSINMEHLEPLKSWLDSCNIKFYEGTANLNWTSIMKHVNDIGLEGFYDDGGWKFLNMQGSSDEEEEESEAESEFEPSGSESEEEESDEDSEGSDFVDSDDEGSGEESLDSDESEGQDWDEAERLAKEKDRKKERYEEDEPPKAKAKGGKGKKGRADYSDPGSDSDEGARPPPKKPKPGASSSKPFKPSKHGGGSSSSSKHGLAKPKSSGLKKSKH